MAEYDFKARCKQVEGYLKAIRTLFFESDLEKLLKAELTEAQKRELNQEIHTIIKKYTNKEEIM